MGNGGWGVCRHPIYMLFALVSDFAHDVKVGGRREGGEEGPGVGKRGGGGGAERK